MTDENKGAVDGGESANVPTETSDNQGGGSDANAKLQQLEKELSSRDAKINKLLDAERKLKEIEMQREQDNLAKKSAEEKVEHFQKELTELKREQILSRKLSGLGVSVDEAKRILDGTAEEQAEALATLLTTHSEQVANTKLDEFKRASIAEVDKQKPVLDTNQQNTRLESMIKAALK